MNDAGRFLAGDGRRGQVEGIGLIVHGLRTEELCSLDRVVGLGRVAEQDIRDEPTGTLREVMVLAADRDLVARQYADAFRAVFDGVNRSIGWPDAPATPNKLPSDSAKIATLKRFPPTLPTLQ